MNLQLLKHGIGTRAAGKAAGFALALWMMGAGFGAWAQVATHTHLSAEPAERGTTFTAKIADVNGNPATDGSVTFATPTGSVGSAFVENGTATLTVNKLPQGTRNVTAAYSGSQGYRSSASAIPAISDATGSSLPDFSLTASVSTVSVSPGEYGNVTITVTPENGFLNPVTLSCSGTPAVTSACIFNPVTLNPLTAAPVSSALQITTQAASGTSASTASPTSGSHTVYAILLPGMLALAGLGALRRRSGFAALRVLGFVALLTASGLGLAACSARYSYLHHPPTGNPGTPAGTYNITVSAYGTNGINVTSHTLNVALTVK